MPTDALNAAHRARLIEIVRERSYGTGVEIKLASGRTSSFYFNMKPTMLHPEGAHLIGTLMAAALSGEPIDLVGGLEMGAVPVATAVAMASASGARPLPAFFVRKQAKGHGTQSLIEGLVRGDTIAGKRVAILEDVTTTGGSALQAIHAVRAEGAEVVLAMTIVDRLEGAQDAFRAAGIRFEALLTHDDFT
ncbi:MAG: orotate phosphoribosyltransferase [Hyphomicrobiaceae bacterium]